MKNRIVLSFVALGLVLLAGFLYSRNLPKTEPTTEVTETSQIVEKPKVKKEVEKVVVKNPSVTIYWVYDDTIIPCELETDYVHACYHVATNSIYLSKELIGIGKDFALYHEIGHSIYKENFPKEIFKSSMFGEDYETLANDFAWWVYSIKYPSEKEFVKGVLVEEKVKYFEETCNADCVAGILGIAIK